MGAVEVVRDGAMEVVRDIEETAKRVEAMRVELVFSDDEVVDGDTLTPVAEQHYLTALSLLEQAQRSFMLAAFASRKGE